MKKHISMILILMILCVSISVYAGFSDVSKNASYVDAVDRIVKLGVMDEVSKGRFEPDSIVTREQFAKIITIASGLEESSNTLMGTTIFSDVDAEGKYNGYINMAFNKGFITGMPDGKFHPEEGITFAQACTAMIRVLGYTDQDIPGLWPRNYMEKAKSLHLIDGITLSNNDKLPRWAAAVMIDELLDTNIKKSSSAEPEKTLAVASGLTVENVYSVYSKPEVAVNFNPSTKKLGKIDFTGNPSITRNGEIISIRDIEDKDVVYEVTDKWNKSRYILVVNDKVEGKITDILPNKLFPDTLMIEGKSYEISKDINFNKINNTRGSFNVGDKIVALIGYDGRVVDILHPESEDNSMFAFVVNYSQTTSTDIKDYGKKIYTVKLLCTDGSMVTYKVESDPVNLKGKLVIFNEVNDETVSIQEVSYVDSKEHFIQIDDRQIDSNYVTDSIKVFNLIGNDTGKDAEAELLNWTDLPYGTIQSGKVLYMNKVGAFEDVNVLLLEDIYDEKYKIAYVENVECVSTRSGSSYNYTMLIEGKEYIYKTSYLSYVDKGTVLKVELLNGNVNTIQQVVNPEMEAMQIQAVDTRRIKINNTIYKFKDNISIYLKDYTGQVEQIGTDDIETDVLYGKVSLYLNKSITYNGKVEVLVINK